MIAGGFTSAQSTAAEEPVKVLYLTKSSGFEHSVVQREKGQLAWSEKIMVELGAKNNMLVVPTKDAGLINADVLKQFDVVQFYTTGDLTQPSKDNGAPMSAAGREALIQWIKNGGGFAGMHTSADTFHEFEPYLKMVGGEFATHGQQEVAKVSVVKDHPIVSHIGESMELQDEWYIFKNVTHTFTPLLMLETKGMKQAAYNSIDPYAITWIEENGNGRVFCTALGHREDVWTNPKFQDLLVKGIKWAAKKL
jgi:type 1 glutamine amidotransferase